MKTTKELVKFDIETAVITGLDAEYKEIQKITDIKSKAIVAEGRRKYRELRLAVVDGHKDEKREALDHCNFLDAEKRRILGLLAPGESHLDDIWQAHKAENEAKERERTEAIQKKINGIRDLGIMLPNVSAIVIKERLIIVEAMQISKEVYQEFGPQAFEAQNKAVEALEEALPQRLQFEREETERKAEAERLEVQRKEQEAAQTKIDTAQKKIDDEKVKLEAEKAQADERRWRSRLDKLATVTWNGQEAIDPQTDRVIISYENLIDFSDAKFAEIAAGWNHIVEERQKAKAEQERKDREEFEHQATIKAEQEAKEKAEDAERDRLEKEEADAKEKARQEALKPDREKLIKFADDLYDIPSPDVKSTQAQKISSEAIKRLAELCKSIIEQAKKL